MPAAEAVPEGGTDDDERSCFGESDSGGAEPYFAHEGRVRKKKEKKERQSVVNTVEKHPKERGDTSAQTDLWLDSDSIDGFHPLGALLHLILLDLLLFLATRLDDLVDVLLDPLPPPLIDDELPHVLDAALAVGTQHVVVGERVAHALVAEGRVAARGERRVAKELRAHGAREVGVARREVLDVRRREVLRQRTVGEPGGAGWNKREMELALGTSGRRGMGGKDELVGTRDDEASLGGDHDARRAGLAGPIDRREEALGDPGRALDLGAVVVSSVVVRRAVLDPVT